jgi:L-threonylcarbamoyladenylate synthase
VIYPGAKNLAKNLLHPDGSVAIRVVRDEFCKSLISLFGKPIVSTSANVSGETTPLIYYKIKQSIIDEVDYVVDLYRDRIEEVKPSTIIKFDSRGQYEIIRS